MSVVMQRYGYSVQHEVVNDRVGLAFNEAASEAKLRVAGPPRITQSDKAPEGELAFDATFEIYPEVKLGELAEVEIERIATEVTEPAIDRTIEILRKQRRSFGQRAQTDAAQVDDRVTIDFEGRIDGELFNGGKADAFVFVIGEGQMLEQFDQGGSRHEGRREQDLSVDLSGRLPGQRRGRQGSRLHRDTEEDRSAEFATSRRRRWQSRWASKAARSEALRADVRKNLEREVKFSRAGPQQGRGDGRAVEVGGAGSAEHDGGGGR